MDEGPAFPMTPVSVESLFIPVLLGLDSNPSHKSASDLNGEGLANGLDVPAFAAFPLGS